MKRQIIAAMGMFALCAAAQPTNSTPEVQIQWNASPSVNDGPLSYSVWWGTNSGLYFTNQTAGTNLWLNVTNMSRSNSYYFAVTAVTTNGISSPFSTEVSFTPSQQPMPPVNTRTYIITP